jgi:hypothetical protein
MRVHNNGKIGGVEPPFSAVVGFDGLLSKRRLEKQLNRRNVEYRRYEMKGDGLRRLSLLTLPDFVGSLSGTVAVSEQGNPRTSYHVFDAKSGDLNIAMQLFYWRLARTNFAFRSSSPGLAFPPDLQRKSAFSVGQPGELFQI